jgi:hypothetical protein
MNFEALVRATGVSGRCACDFWTDLHFANVWLRRNQAENGGSGFVG